MTPCLRTTVPVDTKTCFPMADGRQLVLERGMVNCTVQYRKLDREATHTSWDMVLCDLRLADNQGRLLKLERTLGANLFLELVSTSRNRPNGKLVPLLERIRCYHDHRVWIPTAGGVGESFFSFAYWAKQLDAVLDLLAFPCGEHEQLAIRVHEIPYGAVQYRPAPTICVGTDWAAKIVLWPSLVPGIERSLLGEQPVFTTTKDTAAPQGLVEVR